METNEKGNSECTVNGMTIKLIGKSYWIIWMNNARGKHVKPIHTHTHINIHAHTQTYSCEDEETKWKSTKLRVSQRFFKLEIRSQKEQVISAKHVVYRFSILSHVYLIIHLIMIFRTSATTSFYSCKYFIYLISIFSFV